MSIYRESGRNFKSCIVNAFHIVGILVRIFTFSERARTTGSLVPDRKRVGGVDRTVRSPDTEGVVLQ
jgi:hypothetical protein